MSSDTSYSKKIIPVFRKQGRTLVNKLCDEFHELQENLSSQPRVTEEEG